MSHSLLISNGKVLIEEHGENIVRELDILVRDGKIEQFGHGLAEDPRLGDIERFDAAGKLLMPGLINTHYHSHDTLAKGTLESEPLEYWRLFALPPQYPKRSREEIRARVLLGAWENLMSGTTTVQDMVTLFPFDPEHLDVLLEVYEEIGLRAYVGLQYADIPGIKTIPYWSEIFPEEMHKLLSTAAEPMKDFDLLEYLEENYFSKGNYSDRVSWALGPSAPERCTDDLLLRTNALSEKYQIPIFSHIYESRSMYLQALLEYPEHDGSLIKRLQHLGVLTDRLTLAHCVWITDEEIALLAKHDTNVVLNPLSNYKLKSGIPPLHEYQNAQVNLAIGCDNSSCSDAQNMFQAMKLLALSGAISTEVPEIPQAQKIFHAATSGGAKALLQEDNLGKIALGYTADFTVVELNDPSFVPLNNAVRQAVYAESGRGVSDVIIGGRVVVRDRVLTTMSEEEIIAEVEAVLPTFLEDMQVVRERVDTLRPYLREAHDKVWATDVGMNRLFTGK
ncbi:MAG: amidohydrolase family protein [Microbacteriaceae bacterium]